MELEDIRDKIIQAKSNIKFFEEVRMTDPSQNASYWMDQILWEEGAISQLIQMEHDMRKDIRVHYFVSKQSQDWVDMDLLIKSIYKYVQNNEIHFDYEPKFFEGVLVFGITGFESDQVALRSILGGDIEKLGCKLNYQYSTSIGDEYDRQRND